MSLYNMDRSEPRTGRARIVIPPIASRHTGIGWFAIGRGRHGLGVFAVRPLDPGDRLFQFHGRRISFVEAVAKGEEESYALQVGRNMYVDLDPLGCLVNHSCEPNAGLLANGWLLARRRIRPGDELRYDYSTTMNEDYWTMPCDCGSAVCRGVVRDFKTLPLMLRRAYCREGIVQSHIMEEQGRGRVDRSLAFSPCDRTRPPTTDRGRSQ